MATLAELWTEEPSTKVSPQVQRGRDVDAIKILQTEFKKTTNASDRAAIGREITKLGGEVPAEEPYRIEATGMATGRPTVVSEGRAPAAPAAPASAPESGMLADLWSQVPDAGEQKAPVAETPGTVSDWARRIFIEGPYKGVQGLRAMGETGAQLATGLVAAPIAGLAGLARTALPGEPGAGAETVRAVQQALTFQPKTEEGKLLSEGVHKAFEVAALGAPERGAAVLEKTGSPGLATATEILTNPLNVLPFVPVAARAARPITAPVREQLARMKAEIEPPKPSAPAPVLPSGPVPSSIPAGPTSPTPAALPQLVEQFRQKKGEAPPPGSVGAAGVTKQTQVDQLLTEANPELQTLVRSKPAENVNTDALQTMLLEQKHGVNLSVGQRTNNQRSYASEWNNRGAHPTTIQALFENQPRQLLDAFDNVKKDIAPTVYNASSSELGQTVINALRERDAARLQDINAKYQALRDAAGGELPVDAPRLLSNIEARLKKDLHLTDAEAMSQFKELQRLAKDNNMTYDAFLALRRNLGNEARTNTNGTIRNIASTMIDELEKLPLRAEAADLQPLAAAARQAARDRFELIKSNPAYKEAVSLELTPAEIEAGIPARGAELFIDKHTRQKGSLMRLLDEVGKDSPAHQAIRAHEMEKFKAQSGFKGQETPNFSPVGMTNYLFKTKDRLFDIYGPEGVRNLQELAVLGGKLGKPETGLFNKSNTVSSAIQEISKFGKTGLEGLIAAKTSGASIPVTTAAKKFFESKKAEKFGREAVDPYGGLFLKD